MKQLNSFYLSLLNNGYNSTDILNTAIRENNLETVNFIINNHNFNINLAGNKRPMAPIFTCILCKNVEALKLLKQTNGFNINQPSHIEASSPAMTATVYQHQDIIKEICYDKNVDLSQTNIIGNNLLLNLIHFGNSHKDVFFQMLKICPPEVILQSNILNQDILDCIDFWKNPSWKKNVEIHYKKALKKSNTKPQKASIDLIHSAQALKLGITKQHLHSLLLTPNKWHIVAKKINQIDFDNPKQVSNLRKSINELL